jgi:EAL domain-containing protein (putative c-di-GMP-specific phosphodiesterase class I)
MAVPVSAMCDPHFTELLNNELRRYPTPQRITFEIDEQDLISHYSHVAAFIAQVKSKGVKVMVNNVSSGLITVTRVIRLDVDAILLAPQITEQVCNDIHVAQYIAHMALQCSAANVSLAVCNVEDEQQYDKLIELGVHLLQGRFVGSASPHVSEYLTKLANQARA